MERTPASAATATSTWRCSPTASAPSASRDHDRCRLPLLHYATAQVHHRRHAGARAVHPQHGHGRLDRRPGAGPDRCTQGRARAVSAARFHRLAAADPAPRRVSTRWTWSISTSGIFEQICHDFSVWAAKLDLHDVTFIPISAPMGTTWWSARRAWTGTRGRHCSTTSSTCTWPPTATWWMPAFRCSGSCGRCRPSTTTTAATPARSRPASSAWATRWSCCRPGSKRRSRASTPTTVLARRPSHPCR